MGEIGKCGSPKLVKPAGSSDGELIGDITPRGIQNGKNGNNGKPVGPLAGGLIGIVNMQRALKLVNMVKW